MCLEVAGLPVCGYHGTCVVVNGSDLPAPDPRFELDNNFVTCRCDKGWSQSFEWSLYANKPDRLIFTEELPCTVNKSFLLFLWSIAFVLGMVCFGLHLLAIERISQLKRIFPFLTGIALLTSFALIRLVDQDRAIARGAGFDPLLTSMYALGYLFIHISSVVFFSRYLTFQMKIIPISRLKTKKDLGRKLNFIKYSEPVMIGLDVTAAIFFIVAAVMNQNFNSHIRHYFITSETEGAHDDVELDSYYQSSNAVGETLFKVGFVFAMLRSLFHVYFAKVLVTASINAMKDYVDYNGTKMNKIRPKVNATDISLSAAVNATAPAQATPNNGFIDDALVNGPVKRHRELIRKSIPKLDIMRKAILGYNVALVAFYAPPLLFDIFWEAWKYLAPLVWIMGFSMSLVIFWAHAHQNRKPLSKKNLFLGEVIHSAQGLRHAFSSLTLTRPRSISLSTIDESSQQRNRTLSRETIKSQKVSFKMDRNSSLKVARVTAPTKLSECRTDGLKHELDVSL